MKFLNYFVSLIAVIASAFLCQQIVSNSVENQQYKRDLAELNHVKYGLLSINEWNRQITFILTEEINKLYLSRANKKVLKKHIKVVLNTLIDKVDKQIRTKNAETAGGQISQAFIDMFINLDSIKKGIPEYADAVIHEMSKAKTRREIKAILNKQLKQYSKQTFEFQDMPELGRILLRTDSKDVESAKAKLKAEVDLKQGQIVRDALALGILAVILFILSGLSKQVLPRSRYLALVAILVMLLFAGVTTPTIDMEARISQMSFMLLGHPVHFENQVLYFQSKSILDVFKIMINHREVQMKLVGILLITFSITFPLLKLASTLGFYFDFHHARRNPIIKFFVLHSGKWSMTDVMVVAIFMAYIGFNGIIADQLGNLKVSNDEIVLLTTNGTSLQPGFYLFLTYTLLALYLTELLTRKHRTEA
jgi:hypothetical protein